MKLVDSSHRYLWKYSGRRNYFYGAREHRRERVSVTYVSPEVWSSEVIHGICFLCAALPAVSWTLSGITGSSDC